MAYGPAHDYRTGSPHLKHHGLHEMLVGVLRTEISAAVDRGLPPTLLEVGAGHGGFTEHALALGCAVTATDMSAPSVAELGARYSLNPNFTAVHDPDGWLGVLDGQRYSVIVCASVLHHIPDYTSFLEMAINDHLALGGTLVCLQDPLWYPTMRTADLLLTRVGYIAWRMTQGSYLCGARTGLRRLLGVLDEDSPADMVEYHVVRQGVHEATIMDALRDRFERRRLLPYWSSQGWGWQRLGEMLRRENTFALTARGFRGSRPSFEESQHTDQLTLA